MRVRALFALAVVCTLAGCSSSAAGPTANTSSDLTEASCKQYFAGTWRLTDSTGTAPEKAPCSSFKLTYNSDVTIDVDAMTWTEKDADDVDGTTLETKVTIQPSKDAKSCLLSLDASSTQSERTVVVGRLIAVDGIYDDSPSGLTAVIVYKGDASECSAHYDTVMRK